MKLIRPVLAAILLTGWIFFLNNPIVTSTATIPAPGPFMSPFTGFWHNAAIPDVAKNRISSKQLTEATQVYWDDRLVPHIFAGDEKDALYTSGYIVASQRLWQMDMLARSAQGRLAEVLGGDRLIARDKEQRRMGMLFGAENAIRGWKKDSIHFQLIEAYCNGINDYINQLKERDYPIEYKLMGFKPEPWSPLKTAAIVKYMAQSLCSRESDLEATLTRAYLGDSLYSYLFPSYFEAQTPVIPKGQPWTFRPIPDSLETKSSFDNMMTLYKRPNLLPPPGQGSNNWAVSGSKTKSGFPILCSDPHLRLTLPSIWFENQIHSPEMNAYGVSVPGIPGILIGFNEHIAWGETNVSHDVADWYRVQWVDSNHTRYLLDGQALEVTYKIEEIRIKNQPTIFDTVKYTCWGPVVAESQDDPHSGLAYHWIAHEIPESFEMLVFLNLMKSKNYDDYYQALNGYRSPAQNFVFASKEGDIAITVNGKFPIKKPGQGQFIQDGSSSSNAWQGYVPYEHNPRSKNPVTGYVASANQHSTDPSYPYYYNGDFDHFRGRMVNRTLAPMTQIAPEHMMSLQNNNYSIKAEENLPTMIRMLDSAALQDEEKKELIQKLKLWDFSFDADSEVAGFFNLWYRSMYRLIFDEIYTSKDSSNLEYPETYLTTRLLNTDIQHKIFDLKATTKTESAGDIITLAFQQAIKNIPRDEQGKIKVWKKIADPRIQHLANLPGFSREHLNVGGTGDALNAVGNGAGPSWRMVVELGPEIKARVIFPGGQSGNPASMFYDNMVDEWAGGKYQNALFIQNPDEIIPIFKQQFIPNHGK